MNFEIIEEKHKKGGNELTQIKHFCLKPLVTEK